ncbi:MAG: hypothetical protein LBD66_02320 [Holosporales bacterium]|jgi:hypothetical protein|nr:hypothetical protein [Holosporales bacterium]
MTLEGLQYAWQAPVAFLYGNDTSAKQAFLHWRETEARQAGATLLRQKASFMKGFSPCVQQGLFGKEEAFLILEGVTDTSFSLLNSFLEAFLGQGKVCLLLSPESRKIVSHFARHKTYASCGFFRNAHDRQALVQFFFAEKGETLPPFPDMIFTTQEMEEQCANVIQKLWLLRKDKDALDCFCAESTQKISWEVKILHSLDSVAAVRLLLTRALKTLDQKSSLLTLSPRPAVFSRATLLQKLLEQEIVFKRRHPPPKSGLFQDFL